MSVPRGAVDALLVRHVLVPWPRSRSGRGAASPPSGEGLPDAPGKDVTVRACGTCHEASRAASVRLTKDGWAEVIDGMMKRGARLSDDDFKRCSSTCRRSSPAKRRVRST